MLLIALVFAVPFVPVVVAAAAAASSDGNNKCIIAITSRFVLDFCSIFCLIVAVDVVVVAIITIIALRLTYILVHAVGVVVAAAPGGGSYSKCNPIAHRIYVLYLLFQLTIVASLSHDCLVDHWDNKHSLCDSSSLQPPAP